MRLLQIDVGGNFRLVERDGKNIPHYAILSHTWGDDEDEVTFRDLISGTGQAKAGYQKLRFCSKRAIQDGLKYFWVDTCCIDKSSSAELSEAINSMFRWYQDAAKCYVYLSDISANTSSNGQQPFLNSRWFTRGWTLQELLAPQSVEFFSSEGCIIGSKDSLSHEIATTTGISVEALRGKPLLQFTVEERLSWAEKRETKRDEDAAYCLLGIFNVQIPPIYGEGRRNAMRRLLNEVEDSCGTERILKWLAPPDFATIYHESTSERESDTGQWIFSHPFFRGWLNREHPPEASGRIRWIHGHPGGGKTTLAASIVQHLSSGQYNTPSTPEVYYFFFRHGNPTHTMPVSAYRSILSQFVQRHNNRQDIVEEFHDTIAAGRKSLGQMASSEPELIKLLQKSMEMLQHAYVLLDGIDECSNIKSLVKVIEQLAKISTVRILIFSRPNTHGLARLVEEKYRLPFGQQEVDDDIRIYLRRSLEIMDREHRLRPDADLEQYIQHLATGANKMFLWAKLMIGYLQSPALTSSMIEKLIWGITLPEGLEPMYDRIFNTIGQAPMHQQKLATQIISWVLYSRQDLSAEDLKTVVGPLSDEADATREAWPNFTEVVSMVTCGLVTHQKHNESFSFHLIHISASEYVAKWSPPNSRVSPSDLLRPTRATANIELATTSLRLLLRAGRQFQLSKGSHAEIMRQSMVPYAASYWITHLGASITPSTSSLWDIDRLHTKLEEFQKCVSDFLSSPETIAMFVEVFYRVQLAKQKAFANLPNASEFEKCLEREMRTVSEWTEWAQKLTFHGSCWDFESTSITLREFCSEMETMAKQWEHKLMKDPGLIWRDVLVFHSGRFLPRANSTSTTSFAPTSVQLGGVSSRPLCHISATSKDTNVLGVLSIWPSKQYEMFWRDLDPYGAYDLVESFCTGWTAHYELWSIVDVKRQAFKITVPIEASEVALQMRQAFRHEHDSSWKTSFPTTISPDGLTISILRTLYRFSVSSFNAPPTWKTTVLPLDSMDDFRQKWDSNLDVFNPRNPHIKDLPTSLKLLHRNWYTYTTIFSPDGRYLLFSDHQEPFWRNLVLFEDLSNDTTGPRVVSSITLNTSRAELRFVTFHATYPVVAFVCARSVWVWKYEEPDSNSLSMVYTRDSSAALRTSNPAFDGEIVSICFSSCGRYLSITFEQGSMATPLNMQGSAKLEPSQYTHMHSLQSTGLRPKPMSLQAILCPAVDEDSVVLKQSMSNNQLKQGCSLDITSAGSVSARTSRLVGSTLIEEQAHLLELPGDINAVQAVVKHNTPADADQAKVSIIFNKSSSIAYDMNEQKTELFPTIVQMESVSIFKTMCVRRLQNAEDVVQKPRLKRPIECQDAFERMGKARRANDCSRVKSPT